MLRFISAACVFGMIATALAQPPSATQSTPPPASARDQRAGWTLETGAGVGFIRRTIDGGNELSSSTGFVLTAGLGRWLSPTTALTVRYAQVLVSAQGRDWKHSVHSVSSLNLQRYVGDVFWIGGGLGVAAAREDLLWRPGFGYDLRAGLNLSRSSVAVVNVHVEIFGGGFPSEGYSLRLTGIGACIGYQFL